jgi:hypothetical protein
MLISKKRLADRWGVVPRTLDRRREADPATPPSRIINGRHYFETDEIEAYEKDLASRPQVRPAAPVSRPDSRKRASVDTKQLQARRAAPLSRPPSHKRGVAVPAAKNS